MNILWESFTDKGGRTINEDAVRIVQKGKVSCFVLADGLGAHEKGEEASSLVCDFIIKHFNKKKHVDRDGIEQLLREANIALIDRQDQLNNKLALRTTIVILIITPKYSIYANIGDSRMYYLKSGSICFQSKDHSVCQKLVDWGEISLDQIRYHEDRSKLISVMGESRELGQVNYNTFPVESGAFLLCSDGLWENVTETELEEDYRRVKAPEDWLRLLYQRAMSKDNEHKDNLSAIAVFINQ